MKTLFFFILVFTSEFSALAKPTDIPSEAPFIARAMREVDTEQARNIDLLAPQVLSGKFEGCALKGLAEDCFKVFVGTISIKSSKEALAAMRLAFDAARRDISEKRISKIEARVKTNGNLISILERVDLKKSWIVGYEIRSNQDVSLVQKLKSDVIESMKGARSIMAESVAGSSKNIVKFPAKSQIARALTKEAAQHLKKIQALQEAPYRL